jgi:predicted nucleic acid-binding protein
LTRAFLDTSVLLAGLIDFGPRAAGAQAVMNAVAEQAGRPCLTAWHCCLEFFAVATRLPEEFRLSPADAGRLVEEELLGRLKVVDLPASGRLAFMHEAVRERVAGGRLYDAHIAEIARRAGARLVITDNLRHFSVLRLHGVRVIDSATCAVELAS